MNSCHTSAGPAEGARAVVLCVGIAVLDYIFRVERFPTARSKSPMVGFTITGGGCAANAAIAVARLGGEARFAGPLGDDDHSGRILDGLAREGVELSGVARVPRTESSVSGIFVDSAGERLLTTRRPPGLGSARASSPKGLLRGIDVLLVDNHFPGFVTPVCEAARARGLPVVLDVDRPVELIDALVGLVSHPIFSAEALRLATALDDPARGLAVAGKHCPGFVAVTDGDNGSYWREHTGEGSLVRHQPAFGVEAADTLAAGDVFHAGFALALAEGCPESTAMRFASAAAALKCTRFGGIVGTPTRAEVEGLLSTQAANSMRARYT